MRHLIPHTILENLPQSLDNSHKVIIIEEMEQSKTTQLENKQNKLIIAS